MCFSQEGGITSEKVIFFQGCGITSEQVSISQEGEITSEQPIFSQEQEPFRTGQFSQEEHTFRTPFLQNISPWLLSVGIIIVSHDYYISHGLYQDYISAMYIFFINGMLHIFFLIICMVKHRPAKCKVNNSSKTA